MVEGDLTEEAIESGGPFCNRVLKDQVVIGLPPSRHEGRLNGRGRMERNIHPKRLQFSPRGTSQRPALALDNGAFDLFTH